ncbi:MAG: 30S ribosomal protein S20 [Verrucomicrobiota bacterium]|nr:30S ribosomal protein S20 [Verrucomicrobiota bacterium]
MPNIKSAKRRMRSDATKQARNRSVKSTIKTAERRLNDAIKDGKKEATQAALNAASSAFDKAAKLGVIHSSKADRKKSRLASRANAGA